MHPDETVPASDEVLREAALRRLQRRYMAEGQFILPAVPALLEQYVDLVANHFALLARLMSAEELAALRTVLSSALHESYEAAAQSNVFLRYRVERTATAGISYEVASAKSSLPEEYDYWVKTRAGSLFGTHPDAKVMDTASALGSAQGVSVLDVGAGTGRNSLPLARAGHPTTALELSSALVEVFVDGLQGESCQVQVLCGDIFDETLAIPGAPFQLAVVAEVIPHLRSVEQLGRLFRRLASLVVPGGTLLTSMFLVRPECEPDDTLRQIGQVLWSSFFTRQELEAALAGSPWRIESEDSVLEYERSHLPPAAWPPTRWFESWASGRDVFDLPAESCPIELRWLVLKR